MSNWKLLESTGLISLKRVIIKMNANFINEVRREQVISPFGVGALTVLPDGTSLIIAGLDHWFSGKSAQLKASCELMDWRLAKRLGVEKLYSPPTVNLKYEENGSFLNQYVPKIPALRFPTWYFCRVCHALVQRELDFIGPLRCSDTYHEKKGFKGPVMTQVPYVAICSSGHLNDFPWKEWAHRQKVASCSGQLRFAPSDSSNPQGTRVYCDGCKKSRNLEYVGSTNENGRSLLSTSVERGQDYLCQGSRPWLGNSDKATQQCEKDIFGSFRGSSNVYYSLVENSIYVPASSEALPEELLRILGSKHFSAVKVFHKNEPAKAALQARKLDIEYEYGLAQYTDSQLEAGFAELFGLVDSKESFADDSRKGFLRMEYELFEGTLANERLMIQEPEGQYGGSTSRFFEYIKLVPVLVETSALWGFTRVHSQPNISFSDGKMTLALDQSQTHGAASWLPARQVKGEGIFIKFSSDMVENWKQKAKVGARLSPLRSNNFSSSLNSIDPTSKYVLLHTFSHILIKQLVFFCGYNEASLKERIYVSDEPNGMCGLLIYTASGDSEGTMGGLVRMGKPGLFEQVLEEALESSRWCSNDPVCAESINFEGESSDRLSACYACCLIPETACESFNLFLDRSVISGAGDAALAYFE